MGKVVLTSAAVVVLLGTIGMVSVAAGPAAGPSSGSSRTLSFDVQFSPFQLLHLNPNPDKNTGVGSGDEITFHDTLSVRGRPVGDEGGSCVIVDGAQALANCTEVVRLAGGTVTAQFLNAPPPVKQLAVTGGTGSYRNVGGDGTLAENGNGGGKLTLRLLFFAHGGE